MGTEAMKPAPSEALEKLGKVELLSLDVDGVLTDGGIYYTDDGNTFRKFNAQDGMGLVRLRKAGVALTIISAGAPGAIEHRGRRLGIEHVFTDVSDKLATLGGLAGELGVDMHQVAHVGDDVNDLPLLQAVGLAIASANAVPEVMDAADIVTTQRGGEGAVREICDAMLKARGQALETNHIFDNHLPGEGKGGT
jgi:3-deoxy-D-manno-octulosonate 8-phosphate phosphatase (KDO 8-P phosphatase)